MDVRLEMRWKALPTLVTMFFTWVLAQNILLWAERVRSMSYPTFADLDSQARKIVSLDGEWDFQIDPKEQGKAEQWFLPEKALSSKIRVPGCWQAQGVGLAEDEHLATGMIGKARLRSQYLGSAWYKRKFALPRAWPDQKVWLKLGGVHPSGEVWVNGKYAGASRQPSLPLRLDITDKVRAQAENYLTIRVHEENRGLGGWFNLNARWSGLYRRTEVEVTRSTWIEDLWLVPDVDGPSVIAKVSVASEGDSTQTLAVKVCVVPAEGGGTRFEGEQRLQFGRRGAVEVRIAMPGARRWSSQDPFLYRAIVDLEARGEVLDSVSDRFGMRKIEARGPQLYLNNHPVFLRGYGDDGYFPFTVCPETNREAIRAQLALAKSYGFNYAYPCAYTPPEEYLDAADEVGMLLKIDAGAPLFFQREGRVPGQPSHGFTDAQKTLIDEEWQGLLKWTQNHPSIIIYSPGSELHGDNPHLAEMYRRAKEKDKTRLVMSWSVAPGATDIADTGPAGTHPRGNLHLDVESYVAQPPPAVAPIPLLLHEYIGAESLCDPTETEKYRPTPFHPSVVENFAAAAAKQGLAADVARSLVASSRAVTSSAEKFCIEEARKARGLAGFNMWLFQDIPGLPQGIVDAFWQSKGVSPEEFLRCNSETVLLMNEVPPQLRRSFWAGEHVEIEVFVSHFGAEPIRDGTLSWRIVAQPSGKALLNGERAKIEVACGEVKRVSLLALDMPVVNTPTRCTLAMDLTVGTRTFPNEWEICLLPRSSAEAPAARIALYDPRGELGQLQKTFPFLAPYQKDSSDLVVTSELDPPMLAHLQRGGRLVLLAGKRPNTPLPSFSTCWMPHWRHGHLGTEINATVINAHPALGDFPHGGFCDLLFYHLVSTHAPNIGRGLRLDVFPTPIEPIIRVFSLTGHAAYLFETKVDRGNLLSTSLNFAGAVGVFPEATYLFHQMLQYAASDRFTPRAALTANDLIDTAWRVVVDFQTKSCVRAPGTEFDGGGLERFPQTLILGRRCNWVYAACTPCSKMELHFVLKKLPASGLRLGIEGANFSHRKDRKNRVDLRMAVNERVFSEGPNDFPDDDFGEKTFLISKDHLREGRNTLLISNLEPEGPLGDAPFFAVAYVEFRPN